MNEERNRCQNMEGVDDIHAELFRILHAFKRLNYSSMLPDEITHAELGILGIISVCHLDECEDGVRVSEIGNRMHMTPPAVSRCLKNLDEKGYIIRTVDRKDRRNTYVRLTERGRKIVRESGEIMRGFADAVFGGLGEQNLERLVAYLREILLLSEREIAKRKYQRRKDEAENEEDI